MSRKISLVQCHVEPAWGFGAGCDAPPKVRRIRNLLIHFAFILVITISLLLLAACGASPTATPLTPPTPTEAPIPSGPVPTAIPQSPLTPIPSGGSAALPPGLGGKLVFAPGDGSIWVQDSITSTPRVLVKGSADVFAQAPAFSPDGSQVVFEQDALNARAPLPTSILLVGTDGKNQQVLVKAPDAPTAFDWPTFSPDGKWIYYTVLGAKGVTEVDRVAVQGGAPEKALDDARQGLLSPDGKELAFMRFNQNRFTTSLWIADGDGHNPRLLLNENAFLAIMAPRFSPDGKWILFSASGPPRTPLHALDLSPNRECEPLILCMFAQPAYADGLPWDLWIISVDGQRAQQLTNVGADSPWPAWSRDGKYVAFMDTSGMYAVDVARHNIIQISQNQGHGVLDWWMPPAK
jgi:Tol biopolymer transport system component